MDPAGRHAQVEAVEGPQAAEGLHQAGGLDSGGV